MKSVLRQLAVVAFLGLFAFLGADTLAKEDARLGWGMFAYQIRYQLRYEWLLADGSTRPQRPMDLAGKVKGYLDSGVKQRTRYGKGALQRWLESYARHMYDTRRPKGAVAFRAIADYAINEGEPLCMVVQHPEAPVVGVAAR